MNSSSHHPAPNTTRFGRILAPLLGMRSSRKSLPRPIKASPASNEKTKATQIKPINISSTFINKCPTMVQLEEVEDPELDQQQPGPISYDDDDDADFTDTGPFPPSPPSTPPTNRPHPDSSISTSSLPAPTSETLTERLLALKDMLPPSTRRRISSGFSSTMRVVKSAGSWGGKGMWVLSTSALMVGVPWALAFVEEQQVLEMEREQRAREGAGEVSWFYFFRGFVERRGQRKGGWGEEGRVSLG